MYQITEILIDKKSGNRPGIIISPKGIVSHRTGNSGASAKANRNFFNTKRPKAESSAHYLVDSKDIIRCVPENEKAYHCTKGSQNTYAIGIELCEPLTRQAYLNYVWLHADICLRYGWGSDVIRPHSYWDPVNRPNDTGDLFDWQKFTQDVQYLINEGRKQKGLPPLSTSVVNLKLRDKGDLVKALQLRLNKFGYHLVPDGDFGKMTDTAVRDFQKGHALASDGVVGKKTWEKLK